MEIDYKNLTLKQTIQFVETIDWNRVPPEIIFTKKIIEFSDDFPELIVRIRYIFEKEKIDASLIENLLDEGFYPNWKYDFLLRRSSENGHTEIVKLLLEAGADVHANNVYVIRRSSEYGHTEIVKLLKQYGEKD